MKTLYSKKLNTKIIRFNLGDILDGKETYGNGIQLEAEYFQLLRALHHYPDCDDQFIKQYEFEEINDDR